MNKEKIQQEYSQLCLNLGDLEAKKMFLERGITETKAKIAGLDSKLSAIIQLEKEAAEADLDKKLEEGKEAK